MYSRPLQLHPSALSPAEYAAWRLALDAFAGESQQDRVGEEGLRKAWDWVRTRVETSMVQGVEQQILSLVSPLPPSSNPLYTVHALLRLLSHAQHTAHLVQEHVFLQTSFPIQLRPPSPSAPPLPERNPFRNAVTSAATTKRKAESSSSTKISGTGGSPLVASPVSPASSGGKSRNPFRGAFSTSRIDSSTLTSTPTEAPVRPSGLVRTPSSSTATPPRPPRPARRFLEKQDEPSMEDDSTLRVPDKPSEPRSLSPRHTVSASSPLPPAYPSHPTRTYLAGGVPIPLNIYNSSSSSSSSHPGPLRPSKPGTLTSSTHIGLSPSSRLTAPDAPDEYSTRKSRSSSGASASSSSWTYELASHASAAKKPPPLPKRQPSSLPQLFTSAPPARSAASPFTGFSQASVQLPSPSSSTSTAVPPLLGRSKSVGGSPSSCSSRPLPPPPPPPRRRPAPASPLADPPARPSHSRSISYSPSTASSPSRSERPSRAPSAPLQGVSGTPKNGGTAFERAKDGVVRRTVSLRGTRREREGLLSASAPASASASDAEGEENGGEQACCGSAADVDTSDTSAATSGSELDEVEEVKRKRRQEQRALKRKEVEREARREEEGAWWRLGE